MKLLLQFFGNIRRQLRGEGFEAQPEKSQGGAQFMRHRGGKLSHLVVGPTHPAQQVVDVLHQRGQFGVLLRQMHPLGAGLRVQGRQFAVDPAHRAQRTRRNKIPDANASYQKWERDPEPYRQQFAQNILHFLVRVTAVNAPLRKLGMAAVPTILPQFPVQVPVGRQHQHCRDQDH